MLFSIKFDEPFRIISDRATDCSAIAFRLSFTAGKEKNTRFISSFYMRFVILFSPCTHLSNVNFYHIYPLPSASHQSHSKRGNQPTNHPLPAATLSDLQPALTCLSPGPAADSSSGQSKRDHLTNVPSIVSQRKAAIVGL